MVKVGYSLSRRNPDDRNIRISADAWNLLRRAKFELGTKSYSETIEELNSNLGSNRQKKLELKLNQEGFDEKKHQVNIKSKIPEDESEVAISSKRPKTIMISNKAQRILEEIKLDSGLSGYSYSDAIDFLTKENKK